MKKPNQIVDEITNVIYPPAEAIASQLNTIKVIIPQTIKMYESTKDIHTIQPNLDMIQRAIDYLRGAPMIDELKPIPEDTLNPGFAINTNGFNVMTKMNKDGEYDVTVTGLDIEFNPPDEELFGNIDFKAAELRIIIPVICGKSYLVTQMNPALKHYPDDPDVSEVDGMWVKEKVYEVDEDEFIYALLLEEGRTVIEVAISEEDSTEPIVFNIHSHVHFKE